MASADCVKLTRYFYSPSERTDADLLRQLEQAEGVVEGLVTRPLEPFQSDALICLVSDIVAGLAAAPAITFPKSFLLTAVNRGMFQIAAAEFAQFCFCQGRLSQKAWNKRRAEQLLFSRGVLIF